ncbi:TIM barrel protein [Paenibacillus turpanensis]|uniref:TIM barrel protein n=1 Tax=Paenibacillus turpanensis TaxID=2689078 RepID=UPI00140CC688
MGKVSIGLQMYTIRDATAVDFKAALRQVAELGYEGVEFAGYGDIPAGEMKQLLEELQLKAIGSHVGLHALRTNLQEEIQYLKEIGGTYLVCPYILPEDRGSEEVWKELFRFFGDVAEKTAEQGLIFAYHNHDFEFVDQADGRFVFDALFAATPEDKVKVEMDIGWVDFAGQSPIEYIGKYSGRLPLLHLKDYRKKDDGSIDTVELGQGVLPLFDIIRAAEHAGTEWLIVEQDQCANPPMESIRDSMRWLVLNDPRT